VLDILERYKAKKKQKDEENLMMMRGDYDVPVGGELRPDLRLQLHGCGHHDNAVPLLQICRRPI